MPRIFLIFNLLLVIVTASQTPSFATLNNQDHQDLLFEQGSESFMAGDYKKGLELFLKARDQGLSKISLSYNIGVCAYKLGDYALARDAFLAVSRNPSMAPLAYYNLGLISLNDNDKSAAQNWFDKTIRTTTDAKLKKIATAALERIRPQSTPVWFGFASLGGGYDDNVKIVTDTATLTTSGKGDSFTELLAMARGPIFSPTGHFNLQLTGYSLNYLDENDYDYSSIALKLFHKGNVQSWQSETGANYSYSFLDSRQYARIPSGFIELHKKFSQTMFFRTRYTLSYLDLLVTTYDSYSGTRNRLQLEAGKQLDNSKISIEYMLELNDRDNPDESPTRNYLKLKFNVKTGQHTALYTSIGYRLSSYKINGAIDREEDLAMASLRLAYNIARNWILTTEYNYENNQSNIAAYEYTRNKVMLNITRNF